MLVILLGIAVLVALWVYYSIISPETPQSRDMLRFRTYGLPLAILALMGVEVVWTFYSDKHAFDSNVKRSEKLTSKYFSADEGGRRRRR